MSKKKSPFGPNSQLYQDILADLKKTDNGLFSFSLRVNVGSVYEYVLTRLGKYDPVKKKVIYNDENKVQLLSVRPMEIATFFAIIKQAINQTPHGTIHFNLMVQKGVPRLGTISFNANIRKKYKN